MKKFFKNLFIISLVLISSILIFKNFKDNKNSSNSSDSLESSSVSIMEIIPEGYIKPEGTLDIDANGQYDVKDYESVDVNIEPDYSIEDALISRTFTEYYNDRVTSIGDHAFRQYSGLINVSFPNVESVGANSFYLCSSLESVDLPNATIIKEQAFYGNSNLTNINIPKVEYLYDQCFRNCSKVEIFYLPKLKSITGASFAYCSAIKAIIIEQTDDVCQLSSTTIFNGSSIASGTGFIYVPDLLYEDYLNHSAWSNFASQIKPISELSLEELYYE